MSDTTMTYASYQDYVALTGDTESDRARVGLLLEQQSAMLRATAGLSPTASLSDDAALLAKKLVVTSSHRALAPRMLTGLGDMSDVSQASWTADGFSASAQFANPSGDAYFDKQTLRAFLRAVGRAQSIGTVMPSYGALG